MDKESPKYHTLDIEVEIKRFQNKLTELSPIIHEVERELDRVGPHHLSFSTKTRIQI
jgi:hypothetical protein